MFLSTVQLLALQTLPGVGTQSILKIVKHGTGTDEPGIGLLARCLEELKIKTKDKETGSKIPIMPELLEQALSRAEAVLEHNDNLGIGAISYFDPLFPQSLRDTRDETGKKPDPPFVLFYRGDIDILKMPCVAIIGTREPTETGARAGEYISGEFSRRGFCVVSGLALGCDTCAHAGALKAGGKTLAFMGHGLDTIYPPQNAGLANEIVAQGGLLMSEYPAGTQLSRYSLVARDRLQAGISLATIVIQTGVSGGTMHAANATLNAGKPLFVLGFKDRETESHEKTQGNHALMDKGARAIRGGDNLDRICEELPGEKRSGEECGQMRLPTEGGKTPYVIFDLDMTLVDTSMLEDLRKARRWQDVYRRLGETRLYDCIRDTLDALRARNAKIAIVTSSPKPYVERIIRLHGIPCDYIVDYHATRRHKPDPEPLLHALKLMGIGPEKAISFGDRAIDAQASKAAHIPFVACLWGSSESEGMRREEPSHTISNPNEILELI